MIPDNNHDIGLMAYIWPTDGSYRQNIRSAECNDLGGRCPKAVVMNREILDMSFRTRETKPSGNYREMSRQKSAAVRRCSKEYRQDRYQFKFLAGVSG